MLKGKLNGRLGVGKGRRPKRLDRAAIRFATLESLDQRIMPVVTATFSRAAGVLKITGDARHNQFEVSLTPAGRLRVNNGAVKIAGGRATLARTNLIRVVGRAGNDVISLNETNGALPRARLWGGAGNDVITGGSGDDQLLGQKGNDDLFGKAGSDELRGGAGDDDLTGGDDDDQAFGEAGNDRMIWNPGEDTDLNEGGEGSDVVEVNGGNGNETFTVTPNGARVRFDRTNPAPFSLDIGTSESLVVNANGGDDVVTASTGLAALIQLTADGGAGNDTLNGSDGADVLIGGDGDDFIDGNRGDDTASLGLGNDTFQWDPGDGSDVVEGQAGTDTLQFNGANANEQIDISANGQRTRFFRDVATITMDLDDVERINFEALGGTDTVTVNDLTGTDVTEVNVNLAGTLGGNAGDGLADAVIVNGTNGADNINVAGYASAVAVSGLTAQVNIALGESANDRLTVNALGGDDTVNAAGLSADAIRLTEDGGEGDDDLTGGSGDDTLLGGPGVDVLDGGPGNDVEVQD
jgi:Ca2+-binding RTX toxin-like protein